MKDWKFLTPGILLLLLLLGCCWEEKVFPFPCPLLSGWWCDIDESIGGGGGWTPSALANCRRIKVWSRRDKLRYESYAKSGIGEDRMLDKAEDIPAKIEKI